MICPCSLFDLLKYKNKPYLLTPCASCFMTRETHKTNKHSILFDTDGAIDESQLPYSLPVYSILELNLLTPLAIDMIMKACLQNFLITLSNIVLKLTDLAKTYPPLYLILHFKMQHPLMSYHDIGMSLSTPCSKQNVLYHLTHAVKLFPDLYKAILTDTRFSGGRYAIKNAVEEKGRHAQIDRVRKKLYDLSPINTRKTILELKKLFNKPFKVEVIKDFDKYLEDQFKC